MLETNDDYQRALLSFLAQLPAGQGGAGDICREFERHYRAQLPADQYQELPSGGERWWKRVNWARLQLKHQGLLDGSERGVWRITQAGRDWLRTGPTAADLPRRGASQPRASRPSAEPGISLEMLEQTRKAMPVDQFRQVWGAVYDRLLAAERAKATTDVTQTELGRRAQRRLDEVHAFLRGQMATSPAGQVLCDWIHFCYGLDLYKEAAALLPYVHESEVDPAIYKQAKRVADACRSRLGG